MQQTMTLKPTLGFFSCLLLSFIFFLAQSAKSQNVNDYGAISSGSYTNAGIWRQWDGSGWNTIPASYPNSSTNNVYILSGSIVTVPAPGPYNISSLTVESGAKLFVSNSASNVYLSVWGTNIVCNGEIGNGATFDGIAFNIDGTSCTISGIGIFTASRIRKNATTNITSLLTIAMNVTLRWDQASNTQLYNNTQATTNFNVTVNAGCILNCAGSGTNPGNVSIDGVAGATAGDAGGTITVNGTMIVPGILYATSNNVTANYGVNITIGNGGILKAGQINSPASASATVLTKVNVMAGGKLELTGVGFPAGTINWSTTNNRYDFVSGCTVEYSAAGNQNVLIQTDFVALGGGQNQYSHLVLSGSGTKTIRAGLTMTVRNNLTITGSAVLDQETNDTPIILGGDWTNYNQTGFTESTSTGSYVKCYLNQTIQSIACPGGEQFFNLWIAKSGVTQVRLQDPCTIHKQLKLEGAINSSGILHLNANPLTINNPDSAAIQLAGTPQGAYKRFIISEDLNTTNGAMVKWNIGSSTGTYIIPFGIDYLKDTIPFVFNKWFFGNLGTLSVATYGTPPNNLPWPTSPVSVTNLMSTNGLNNTPDNRDWTVDRFWYVGATNYVAGCNMGFTYNDRVGSVSELPVADPVPGNLRAQYWLNLSSYWDLPQLGTASVPPVPINGVAVLNVPIFNTIWTLASTSSPLPVEMLDFRAQNQGSKVSLNWITASEENSDFFDVQRSVDGTQFEKIGTVKAAGNSSSNITYTFFDGQPLQGVSYYRLRQVDFDGQYTYSTLVSVSRQRSGGGKLYPQPAGDVIFWQHESADNQLKDLNFNIYSTSGALMLQTAVAAVGNLYRLDVQELPQGLYFMRISDGLRELNYPLVISR